MLGFRLACSIRPWALTFVAMAVAVAALAASSAHAGTAVQVVSGNSHSCALTMDGAVRCWGYNYTGQLGDGTFKSSGTPVEVVGLEWPVASLTAGHFHMCALSYDGLVACWGDNGFGQVGAGPELAPRPVRVNGIEERVLAIDAGLFHTCAALVGGGVRCWGENVAGELGIGAIDYDSHNAATDVIGLDEEVRALAGGDEHTCALTASGAVLCWGRNDRGALGDGGACGASCPAPVPVLGLDHGVTAIAAGSWHTCALLEEGSVRCWGRNRFGSLGDGTTTDSAVPVEVVGLPAGVTGLRASPVGSATCALLAEGRARCWGMNTRGLLGDGTEVDRLAPVALTVLTVAVGGSMFFSRAHA